MAKSRATFGGRVRSAWTAARVTWFQSTAGFAAATAGPATMPAAVSDGPSGWPEPVNRFAASPVAVGTAARIVVPSSTPTRTPPRSAGSPAKNDPIGAASEPRNASTAHPPPGPVPVTMSVTPSESTSPVAR